MSETSEILEQSSDQPAELKDHGTTEKAPGVYVRTGKYQPHELDMLWSGSRHFTKEDRSPVVFTLVGLLVGAIITSAVFFLFSAKPQIKAGNNDLTTPIVDETDLVPMAGDPIMSPEEEQALSAPAVDLPMPSIQDSPSQLRTPSGSSRGRSDRRAAGSQMYSVQSGDTLERIAQKFYGSGTPEMVEKISRANNMKNIHALQIGQKLVIPPQNY